MHMQVVTPQERTRMHHVLQQEAACMAVMLSNACMVHKLVRSQTYIMAYAVAAEISASLAGDAHMHAVQPLCPVLCVATVQ